MSAYPYLDYRLSTDTLDSRTNSSASVRRGPYTRAYLHQRATQSDYTSYSSCLTLNKSFSDVSSLLIPSHFQVKLAYFC